MMYPEILNLPDIRLLPDPTSKGLLVCYLEGW
jgi:hypothetical protein